MKSAKTAGYCMAYRFDDRNPSSIFGSGFLPKITNKPVNDTTAQQVADKFLQRIQAYKQARKALSQQTFQDDFFYIKRTAEQHWQNRYNKANLPEAEALGFRKDAGDIGRVDVDGYAARMVCLSPMLWGAAVFAGRETSSTSGWIYLCLLPYTQILKTSKHASFISKYEVSNVEISSNQYDLNDPNKSTTTQLTAVNEIAVPRVNPNHVLYAVQVSGHRTNNSVSSSDGGFIDAYMKGMISWSFTGMVQENISKVGIQSINDQIEGACKALKRKAESKASNQTQALGMVHIYDWSKSNLQLVPEDIRSEYEQEGGSWYPERPNWLKNV